MHQRNKLAGAAAVVALALLIGGCSSNDAGSTASTAGSAGGSAGGAGGGGGTLSIANAITTDPIIPMTVDTATTRVMDLVWTGLVRYDDKLAPYNANAELPSPPRTPRPGTSS